MAHDCQYMQFTIKQPTTMQMKNEMAMPDFAAAYGSAFRIS
jgi:hypothetical protein